ncbi:MAG: 1-acyl-sn-glycerol-3-phosphate acyltransferase [Candidatus Kerfeldbacteria bacterium]|nr:1-acyl-sn-glycerol-3-phosphate acyltransferase [Candidatus Kerfeldbacteria bacterium]
MAYDRIRRNILPTLARRIEVHGLEHVPAHGPYIIVANHQSYTDPVQIAFPLIVERNVKVWFLTTEHIWKLSRRLGGERLMTWLGMIPIRESAKAESLEPALRRLQVGEILCIFPEGMRNKPKVNPQWEKVMLKGKTGTARLALATGVPVIPAGIVAPKGLTAFQAIKNYLQKRQPAEVRFGAPMNFSQTPESSFTKALLEEATKKMMLEISKLCGKAYPH